jgi:hypothetical protein
MVIRIFSSNKQTKIYRTYNKLLDVFANTGGISDLIIYAIVIMYGWYNSVRMDQTLLN